MPCLFRNLQIRELTKATRLMSANAFSSALPGYQELSALRQGLIESVIPSTPRISVLIRTIIGLSPGHVRVWHDNERGWIAEGVKEPGSHPEYHLVTEAEAKDLLSEHPTPALAHRMMEPDPYVGE